MVSESQLNHVQYQVKKEEKPVEVKVEKEVKEVTVDRRKPEPVSPFYEATDVNKDGKTDIKDAVKVVNNMFKRKKKRK